MIQSIKGKLKAKGDGFVIVDVHGIGFKVFILDSARAVLQKIGGDVELSTYFQVREDAWTLYGFINEEELIFFEKLISVSGIGPKTAITIMSSAPVEKLKAAIAGGESELIQKSYGIGKKTADRIVLELKDKLKGMDSKGTVALMESDNEIYDALIGLGYSSSQTKIAIAKINPGTKSTNDRIREALKIIKG